MSEATPPTRDFSAARFLLMVKADTAPSPMMRDGVLQLQELLHPIAASNRIFLNAITPLIQQTTDAELLARGVAPVRTGLAFDAAERQLNQMIGAVGSYDADGVIEAAKVAQVWGWLALRLRDETQAFREYIAGTAPTPPSPAGAQMQMAS